MKNILRGCLCAAMVIFMFAGQHCFASRADLVQKIDKAKDYLDDVNAEPDKAIPSSFFRNWSSCFGDGCAPSLAFASTKF